jgi:alanine-alpha-ketoisovalerate/valine-pyruvate aminotransferase
MYLEHLWGTTLWVPIRVDSCGRKDEDCHLGSTTNCAVEVTSSTKGQPITEMLENDSLCKLYSRSVAPFLNDKVKNVVWFIRSLRTVLD